MAKKAIYPDIVRGGIAIPIPNKTNYYYMKGKKHKDGGIDIGKNPRTGLEVEDGEVLHLTDNNIKVYSSVPFLNGKSPAEKVMGGENPNKVFKQQEDFKDRNKLNDDGTRKAGFGKWLKNTLIKGAQLASEASRDVRTGGASSHVKELVDKGKHEEAKQFAENYFKANTLGISLGAGAASNKLATDLLITTGTSAADAGANFVTKDTNSAAKQSTTDTAINIAGDVLGKGIGKVLDIGPVKQYIGKKLGYVEDMNGYIKEGSHFRIVDKPAIDDAIQSGSIRAKTGLYHGTPEYLRENFSKYLPQLGDWETMDAFEIRKRLKELGAIGENNLLQTMYIRNSTNHGGTVGYFRNTPYPNYLISKDNYVIETPESLGVFVPGHHGKEHINIPLDKAGATVLKTNGSIKNASIPTKGSSYWKYSPFWGMWKNTKFNLGGEKSFDDSTEYPKYIRKNKKAMDGTTNKPVTVTANGKTKVVYSPSTGGTRSGAEGNRAKAKLGTDIIGLSSNLIGSGLSFLANRKMLKNLKDSPKPVSIQPTKLKTKININSSLDKMRETAAAYNKAVDSNTSSSRVALARKNRLVGNMLGQYNSLIGDKENREAALINQDRLNRQTVAEKNIAAYNNYLSKQNALENAIIEKKAENTVGLISNLNKGVQEFTTNKQKNRQFKNNLIAMSMAYPNVNVDELLKKLDL